MTDLQYPLNLSDESDYMVFEHFPFQLNTTLDKGKTNKDHYAPKSGRTIKLYMPNTTPGSFQNHDIKKATFPGMAGRLQKSIISGMAKSGELGTGLNTQQGFKGDIGIGSDAEQIALNVSEGIKQQGLDFIAGQVNSDAATAVAIGLGKQYNPNAEMIYRQPVHREFPFTFDFMPKSAPEATMVDRILYEFKQWSAPDLEDNGAFITMPHLWRIKYVQGGGHESFKRMTVFKACMIESFAMQDNPDQKFHMTIDDPKGAVPIHTTIQMTFVETQPIYRRDHVEAVGQGYLRGM